MLKVDNKIINTPVIEILNHLQSDLVFNHINKLEQIEIKHNNARFKCPIHAGGNERTPSCDMLLEDNSKAVAGTVHCFGCGYKASLIKFIADCKCTSYRAAKEWLFSFVNYSLADTFRDVEYIDINNINERKPEQQPEVSVDELKQYDYIHPYMYKRKLTDDIIFKYEVGYDPKLDAVTFPVYVDGRCEFVAKRRVGYKRFDMPKLDIKPIYGLDYIRGKEVIVCESIINALTCESYGKEAIALFGTGSSNNYQQLNKTDIRHFILMFDGDDAGRHGAERFIKNVKNAIVTDIEMPKGKDVNDLSKEEFYEILSKNGVS